MRVSRQRGFGLIEVLVAFVVIATGAAALVKLQGAYLRSTAESGTREAAMHLAETKLDDLRSFEVVATTSGKVAYQDIGNNTGGQLAAGSHTVGTQVYTLAWTVSNQFLTSPANTIPERKDVTISVSWDDRTGTTRTLALSGSIAQQLSAGSSMLTGDMGMGEPAPQVSYAPGSAPDVIAIALGNNSTVETSKPMPTVFQRGNTIGVQFEQVTYDASTNKQVQQDLLTLACSCALQTGTSNQYLPSQLLQTSYGLYWQAGETMAKTYGQSIITQAGEEKSLCTLCCANHFDGTTTSSGDFKLYYNQDLKGSHTHTSSYNEACRLMRLDGLYIPMPDWNLAKLNVMSTDFLTNSLNQVNYQKYVQALVKTHVSWQKGGKIDSFSFDDFNSWLGTSGNVTNGGATTTAVTVTPGLHQLIARGVYVDYLSSTYLSQLNINDSALLSKVPFNELNLTLLANWSVASADQTYLTVTNEAVNTVVNVSANYYGVYSRGRLNALLSTGDAFKTVSASIRRSNSGLTASTQALTSDLSDTSATLAVKVQVTSVDKVNVHGTIKCLSDPSQNSSTPNACTGGEWNGLTLTSSNSGVSCSLTKPTGQNTDGTYSCDVNRGSTVVVTVASSGYLVRESSNVANDGNLTFDGALTSPGTGVLTSQGPCVLVVKNTVSGASTMGTCTN